MAVFTFKGWEAGGGHLMDNQVESANSSGASVIAGAAKTGSFGLQLTNATSGISNAPAIAYGRIFNSGEGTLTDFPAECYWAFQLRITAIGASVTRIDICAITDDSNPSWPTRDWQLSVEDVGGGAWRLRVRDSADTLVATGSATISTNTWYYLQVRVLANGTTGSCTVKIDSNTDINVTNQNFGSLARITTIWLVCGIDANNTTTLNFDDFYIKDTAGPTNDWLSGTPQVTVARATGNGTYASWSLNPGTGEAMWEDVDDPPPDDDGSTTIFTSTQNNKSSVHVQDASVVGITTDTIHAVATVAFGARDAAATVSTRAFMKIGASEPTSPAGNAWLQNDYTNYCGFLRDDAPGSTGWTRAEFDATEFGVTHSTSQTRRVDCTSIYAMVLWTPAAPAGASFPFRRRNDLILR